MTGTAAAVADRSERAMASRLRCVAKVLLDAVPEPAPGEPAAQAAALVDDLVTAVARQPSDDRIWLLLCALGAAYPQRSEVDRLRRRLELLPHRAAVIAALELGASIADAAGDPEAEIELAVGKVVVDVDHSARYDLHTGIQRVVRCLLPHWRDRAVLPAAWNRAAGSLRPLRPVEAARVFEWTGTGSTRDERSDGPDRLLVPWRSVVVIPEVPPTEACDRLGAIGDDSGNRLVGVIHDAIPVVSADMVPSADSSKFVRFLTCAKFAHRFAGVSRSATAEMAGFVRALRTQGLVGPQVTEVRLASPLHPGPPPTDRSGSRPGVLVVGSHEPRKNHLAVLFAAETLWREGLDFSLEFIGGSGWGEAFPRRAAELRAKGRPLQVRRAVSDAELDRAYRQAAFTVFPSLHEGFGLPVAESLAHGTPVITSDFGSTAEIAEGGGALLVDPRDDAALIAAMRRLLTEPETREELRRQIGERPERTWAEYADELWAAIVEPELALLEGTR